MARLYDMHILKMSPAHTADDLVEKLDKAGFYGGAVFSEMPPAFSGEAEPAGGPEGRLDRILAFAKDYPGRLLPVLFLHPDDPDVLALVGEAAARGIAGYKVIYNNCHVYDDKSMEMLSAIAKTGKPVCFHTGILWDRGISGEYNRPLHWEHLFKIPGIRFSLAHCGWPWYDECIALYGKFLYLSAQPDMSCEMFLDTTPGTPPSYRRDLLTKLVASGYDVEHNIMFGTDCSAHDYNAEWAQRWLRTDAEIFDSLGVPRQVQQQFLSDNVLRFFGLTEEAHTHKPLTLDGR